ncbi:MAG: HD-GYP domain-containing protein, partial [Pseudomonadales bacterium]
MIHIPVSKLEPEMVLAAPVRHPTVANHVLLHAGYRLEPTAISRLNRLAVRAIWIRHPGFDFLDDKLGDNIPSARAKLYQTVKRSFMGIASKTSGTFDLTEYRRIIGNMIISMVRNKKNAVWAQRLMDDDDELFAHSSNVAYIALVIGMRLKDYIFTQRKFADYKSCSDLTNLGIGAMLHDLGKLGLTQKWRHTHFFDEHADTDEYRSHAEKGYRAVQGRLEATASAVVLHHHQRFDGQGFPQLHARYKEQSITSLAGHNIHIFSRIVTVANAIDGLIRFSQERNAPIVAALAAIQQPA